MPLLPPDVHEHFPDDRENLTPLFKQYTGIKDGHPEGLLLYRLGDFYEMFGPDAVRGSAILGLTLTSRACYKGHKVAMCGIPHHASARYIRRLVEAGEVVAICEQTEDPADAKGLVERGVTRVITAGTIVEDEYLSEDSANFLAVIAGRGKKYGAALLDSSGGSVELFEVAGDSARGILAAVLRHKPAEVLTPRALRDDPDFTQARTGPGPVVHEYDEVPGDADVEFFLTRYFDVKTMDAYGLGKAKAAQAALFALVRYLRDTFKVSDIKLYPRLVPLSGSLYLDARAAAHLELLGPADSLSKGNGLYDVLNHCRSSAGRRELKARLLRPLADDAVISRSHDAVARLISDRELNGGVTDLLDRIQDVERIVQRVTLGRTHPKEVRALADSLQPLGALGQLLLDCGDALLSELGDRIGDFSELTARINLTLADDPPVRLSDGNVIRGGADARVDELRDLVHGGKDWMERFQDEQRERTGIRTLKVKHTDAFGYFIEVSKANLALVPDDYERRQTLVNNERFVTDELKQRDTDMKSAEGRLLALERQLFEELIGAVATEAANLARAARSAAAADVLLSLAAVAREGNWVRPELAADDSVRLEIEGGRHPVVERAVGDRYYTPNDCFLDQEQQQVMLLTGPNMGGKSTYLRMVAVLAVLNQLGGFVPAERAVLPVFSRVYTRVGAQDHLALGQSTFMVEMVETAEILNTCSGRSLILLDEVGRGTSTYDGISIAKAVVEHLHRLEARPLTLFATHFFELIDLELVLPRVKNFQVEVTKDNDRFLFLYRVSAGAASESFGVEVAALAGLPSEVVDRARQILRELEDAKNEARQRARRAVQLDMFDAGG